jgi:hypothetical protein
LVFESLSSMRMRGFWVTWSPDSPGSDAMTPRTEPGNPGAKDKVFATTQRYSQIIARGNPGAAYVSSEN